jgi:hypothetical protein
VRTHPALLAAALVIVSSVAVPASAQQDESAEGNDSLDTEARALFEAGSTAFEDARYADALGHFQRAYELSERPRLLYNIGLAADRLRRDEIALEAFEQFLAEVPDHPRRRDVRARVEVLREAVERGTQAPAQVDEEPVPDDAPSESAAPEDANASPIADRGEPDAGTGVGGATIAGASVLGGLGVAGVVVAVTGIAGAGECVDMVGTTCVEERKTNWTAVGVYGGLGIAAIAGAVIWLVAGMSSGSDEDAAVAFTADGVRVTW